MSDAAKSQESTIQLTDAALIGLVRLYITSGSLPLQGPVSGAKTWVQCDHALAALDQLEARRGA